MFDEICSFVSDLHASFFRMHITITFSAFLKLYEKFKISILLLFSDSKKYPEVVPADNSCMANIITN
jgi:hypothetical protein